MFQKLTRIFICVFQSKWKWKKSGLFLVSFRDHSLPCYGVFLLFYTFTELWKYFRIWELEKEMNETHPHYVFSAATKTITFFENQKKEL